MKRNNEKGVILPFLAITLPVLIASLGLVLDNGAMYELKRRLQTAADAGALAGAHEIHRSNHGGIQAASLYDAKQNGFEANPDTDSVVTVNNPPSTGRYAGDPAFVEVVVEERAPLFFMTAFVDDGYLVRARAVAGTRQDNHCLYVLDAEIKDAFNVGGGATANFSFGVVLSPGFFFAAAFFFLAAFFFVVVVVGFFGIAISFSMFIGLVSSP